MSKCENIVECLDCLPHRPYNTVKTCLTVNAYNAIERTMYDANLREGQTIYEASVRLFSKHHDSGRAAGIDSGHCFKIQH